MPSVSNENLIVLKWQNIHVISNIKYTAIYIYIYIYILTVSKLNPADLFNEELF